MPTLAWRKVRLKYRWKHGRFLLDFLLNDALSFLFRVEHDLVTGPTRYRACLKLALVDACLGLLMDGFAENVFLDFLFSGNPFNQAGLLFEQRPVIIKSVDAERLLETLPSIQLRDIPITVVSF